MKVHRLLARANDFQQRHVTLALPIAIAKKYDDDNGGLLVTNLAYSGFLALFPLLLVLVTVLGLVLSGDPSVRQSLLRSTFADFPVVGSMLSKNIHAIRRDSVIGLVVGVLGLLWGSTGIAQAGQYAMAEVWNIPGTDRPGFAARTARSFAFLGVLALGLVLSAFLASFGTFGRHEFFFGIAAEAVACLVNIAQYYLAFRFLTLGSVRHRQLLPGAITGGIAWTVLLAIGGYLVGHDLKGDSETYGFFGIVLGLLAWIYLGSEISVYAAEINSVLARRMWPRSLVHPPLTPADRLSLSLRSAATREQPGQHVEVTFDRDG
jgi:YihY family inner membrane protein